MLAALEVREESLAENIKDDISELRKELHREELSDELISLLADQDVVAVVFEVLEDRESEDMEPEAEALFKQVDREARTLFDDLAEFRVFEFKRRGLEEADEAGVNRERVSPT